MYSMDLCWHVMGFPHVLESPAIINFIFKAWKFLENSSGPWKSLEVICGVLGSRELDSCRVQARLWRTLSNVLVQSFVLYLITLTLQHCNKLYESMSIVIQLW